MVITNDISCFTVIATRDLKTALLKAISEHGGRFTNIMYGKGTVKSTALIAALGFVPENEKIVITFFVAKSHSDDIINMLDNEFHFDKPNTGIAFSYNINKIAI